MGAPGEGPLLGLDVGARRIGLAVSDPLRLAASGAGTVDRQAGGWMDQVEETARRYGVVGIVVGLPRRTDGSRGPEAEAALRLGRRLASRLGVPVAFWDERLTTVQAERALMEGGLSRARRRKVVDQTAAVLILQGFLDAQRWTSGARGRAPGRGEEELGSGGSNADKLSW